MPQSSQVDSVSQITHWLSENSIAVCIRFVSYLKSSVFGYVSFKFQPIGYLDFEECSPNSLTKCQSFPFNFDSYRPKTVYLTTFEFDL